MLRRIAVLLAVVFYIGMMGACSQPKNDTTRTKENIDEITSTESNSTSDDDTPDGDITVVNTTTNEMQQTEPIGTSANETGESEISVQTSYWENGLEIPADKIFLNPDGEKFAKGLGYFDIDYKEPVVQYWDTGKHIVKFESYTDKELGHVFKVNNHAVDCVYVRFGQILVEDEYIIIVSCGTDVNTNKIFIYDYDGNTLFKTFYLSNTGMVHEGKITVTDNKIILYGTRMTHGPAITIGCNKSRMDEFSEYSDYLYGDTVYDYSETFGWPYFNVILDDFNINKIKLLNPNEKTDAVFEMEYLGDGKFSKLNIVSYRTLGEIYPYYFE